MIVFRYLFLSALLILISIAEEVGIPYIPLSHSKAINVIDNNESLLISGSEDSSVKIWDIEQKKLIKTFRKHKFPIQYVKFLAKENLVLSIDKKSQLYLWNIKTEKIVKEYKLPLEVFSSLAYIPNTTLLFMSGYQKTIVLNLLNGKKFDATYFYKGYYSGSNFTKTSQIEKKILLSTRYIDKKLRLYDINGTVEQFIPFEEKLCTVDLSFNAKHVAAAFKNKTLKIYSSENSELLTIIDTGKVCSNGSTLRFSPSGKSIALVKGYDVNIWDINTSKKIFTLTHSEQIYSDSFSFIDDENYLVGLSNGKVKHVNININRVSSFNTYARRISKVAFSKDSKKMYASNHPYFKARNILQKYYSLINYKTKEETKLLFTTDEDITTALHLSEKRLTIGHFDGSISIWDLKKKDNIKKKIFDDTVACIDINEKNKMLAVTNNSGEVSVLDIHSYKTLFNFKNNKEYSQNLEFSVNGEYLLYVNSYSYKVWKTSNWEMVSDTNISVSSSTDIKFKDNHTLLMINDEKEIIEYDILTKMKKSLFDIKEFIQTEKLNDSDIDQFGYYRFSHDSDKLLFGLNSKVYILNLHKKESIELDIPFENSKYFSKVFHFNFDDTVVSCVDYTTLYLWDVHTGEKIDTYSLYTKHNDLLGVLEHPVGDIKMSYSKNNHLMVSGFSQRFFPPFATDEINIWDTEKIKVEDKLVADNHHYISDFVVYDEKIIYASDYQLTEVSFDTNATKRVKKYKINHNKVLVWDDTYILDIFKNELYLIDKKNKKILKTFSSKDKDFISAGILPNGKEIMAITKKISQDTQQYENNMTVQFYDIQTGKMFGENTLYADAVTLNEKADMLALINYATGSIADALLGSFPSIATIINLKNNKIAILKGHKGNINSIAFSKDNAFVITGSDDGTIKLWDTSSGELINTYMGHDGSVNSVVFHPEKPFIVSASNDGTIRYWNMKNNQLVVTFMSFENEWVVLTPEGFFNGTQKGIKKLNILYDFMHIGEMNNIFDIFFRPDLVKLKLEGNDLSVYTKKINLKSVLKDKPPTVKVYKVNNIQLDKEKYYTDEEKVNLTFNIKEHDGGGVGLIRVYQEGKLIQTIGEGKVNKQSANIDAILEQEKLDRTLKKNQKSYIASLSKSIEGNISIEDTIAKVQPDSSTNKSGNYEIEIELRSGKNEISIEAFNKTNTVTSYRENITINANIPKHKPKLYAIVAGVNEFETNNKKYRLKYSENDANAMKEIIEEKMSTVFSEVEVIYLGGKDLTQDNILKAANNIAKRAKLDDTILFYISTHGRAAKGKLYLVPYNNKSVKNWIDFEQTFQAVQSIKALNQIFIIDACESGKANDIVSSVYDSRASVLAKSSGVHMLLATTKGTYAFEHPDPNISNGVFTHKILKALHNKTTDTNKDSIISILELSKKLKEPINNADYQYPVIRNVGKDVELEKVVN